MRLAALAALLVIATFAAPLAADGPKPRAEPSAIKLSADKLDVDIDQKRGLLEGHVKLERGDMRVTAPRVEVRYDELPHVTWLKATGGVIAEVKGVRAEAPEAEFDVAARTLTLGGGVRIARGDGWIRAAKATVHIGTGKISLHEVTGEIPIPRDEER